MDLNRPRKFIFKSFIEIFNKLVKSVIFNEIRM